MKKNIFISATIIFLILVCIINAQDTEYGYSDDIPPIEIKVNFNSTLSGKEKITNDTTKIYKSGDKVNLYIDIYAIIPDNYSNRTINAYISMNNLNTNDIIYLQGDQLNEFYSFFTYKDYIEKKLNKDNISYENLSDSILSNFIYSSYYDSNTKNTNTIKNNNMLGILLDPLKILNPFSGIINDMSKTWIYIITNNINNEKINFYHTYKVAIKTSSQHEAKPNKFIFQINPKEKSNIDIYIDFEEPYLLQSKKTTLQFREKKFFFF